VLKKIRCHEAERLSNKAKFYVLCVGYKKKPIWKENNLIQVYRASLWRSPPHFSRNVLGLILAKGRVATPHLSGLNHCNCTVLPRVAARPRARTRVTFPSALGE
jgi:hypothetical protein